MTAQDLYLNLDFMPPTAERFCLIPEKISKSGVERIILNIVDNFPWSFECRLQSSTAYTDNAIDFFFKSCSKYNIGVNYIFPEQGDFVRLLRLNGYRRMALNSSDIFLIDSQSVGFEMFVESLMEDLLSLCPEIRTIHFAECETDYSKKVGAIIEKAGLKIEFLDNLPGYEFAADLIEGKGSKLHRDYILLENASSGFFTHAGAVRQNAVMLSLGSPASLAGGRGIGKDYRHLLELFKKLDNCAHSFFDSAKGKIEPMWLDIYMKSIMLTAEEEMNSIKDRLRQLWLLN